MDPDIWGPHAWMFLHSVTLAYPEKPTDIDKTNFEKFFNSLQPVLPCKKCSDNYKIHIDENPILNHLDNKEKLVKWLIDIHNRVNRINGKKDYTYEEAINHYKSLYSLSKNDLLSDNIIIDKIDNNYLLYIFIVLIILLVGYYLYRYYKNT
jgi:hypothetical protein